MGEDVELIQRSLHILPEQVISRSLPRDDRTNAKFAAEAPNPRMGKALVATISDVTQELSEQNTTEKIANSAAIADLTAAKEKKEKNKIMEHAEEKNNKKEKKEKQKIMEQAEDEYG